MLNRRAFLTTGGVALFTVGAGPTFLERAASAAIAPQGSTDDRVLVTIFQRGAMDGLAAVPPLGGRAGQQLKALRPRLYLDAVRSAADRSVRDLGVGFGLHPAFDPLLPMWRDGRLGIVHNMGSPHTTRSHFDAQDYMETGTPGRKGTADGWLNRVVGRLGHDATPFRAVSLTPALPRSLYGDHSALAVTNLRDFKVDLPGASKGSAAAGEGFEALYDQTSQELLHDTAADTFEAVDMLKKLDVRNYRPATGADYPRGPLGASLQQIAFLIKSKVGLQVAFAESGGWDTHVQQGTVTGSFARQARELSQAIAAFWHDLGVDRDRVTLMTMTEFGRTAAENGTGGTDHGHGSCLFVLGNNIDGGKVHGDFPGLDRDQLYEGRDLPVTTDFRSIFSEVTGQTFGIAPEHDSGLFPGWSGKRLPLFKRV